MVLANRIIIPYTVSNVNKHLTVNKMNHLKDRIVSYVNHLLKDGQKWGEMDILDGRICFSRNHTYSVLSLESEGKIQWMVVACGDEAKGYTANTTAAKVEAFLNARGA